MAGSVSSALNEHIERLQNTPTDNGLVELIERLTREGLISMKEAAELYGRGTHKSTPTRHHLKGFKGANGITVYLEAIRVGGALCTSRAAVLRFFAAQNAAPAPSESAPTPTPKARNRAAAAAHDELAAVLGTK